MKCLSLLTAGVLMMSHTGPIDERAGALFSDDIGGMHETELKSRATLAAPYPVKLKFPDPDDNLFKALQRRDIEAAKKLLQQGASANEIVQSDGSTLLHMAALYGYLDFVHLLLGRLASINRENGYGERPLHYAAMGGSAEVVSSLLAFAASVDARDMWDKTPLHKAAWRGNAEALKTLLRGGADVNATFVFQHTALHEAARKGHLESVQLLVEAGAKLEAKTRRGETALDLALKAQAQALNKAQAQGFDKVVAYLQSAP